MNMSNPDIELNRDDDFKQLVGSLEKVDFDPTTSLSTLDLFINSKIFCIVAKSRRNELTKVEKINKKTIKTDLPIIRKFKTNLGYTCMLNGPLLGLDDGAILEVLINFYYLHDGSDGEIQCTYRQIGSALGYKIDPKKGLGGSTKQSIERSLVRLRTTAIQIRDEDGELIWIDNILSKFKIVGKGRGLKLSIKLNSDFIPQYKHGHFFFMDLYKLNSMEGDWEQAVFRFVSSVNEVQFKISVDKLYNLFHENVINSKQLNNVKNKISKAILSLSNKGILESRTFIDKNYMIHFFINKNFVMPS